jgi:hypothetical protein
VFAGRPQPHAAAITAAHATIRIPIALVIFSPAAL